jgi:hypothetical protein
MGAASYAGVANPFSRSRGTVGISARMSQFARILRRDDMNQRSKASPPHVGGLLDLRAITLNAIEIIPLFG